MSRSALRPLEARSAPSRLTTAGPVSLAVGLYVGNRGAPPDRGSLLLITEPGTVAPKIMDHEDTFLDTIETVVTTVVLWGAVLWLATYMQRESDQRSVGIGEACRSHRTTTAFQVPTPLPIQSRQVTREPAHHPTSTSSVSAPNRAAMLCIANGLVAEATGRRTSHDSIDDAAGVLDDAYGKGVGYQIGLLATSDDEADLSETAMELIGHGYNAPGFAIMGYLKWDIVDEIEQGRQRSLAALPASALSEKINNLSRPTKIANEAVGSIVTTSAYFRTLKTHPFIAALIFAAAWLFASRVSVVSLLHGAIVRLARGAFKALNG